MKRLISLLAVFALVFAIAGCGGKAKEVKAEEPVKKEPVAVVAATLLTITIEGATYSTLTDLKGKLTAIKGVKNIYQGSFSKGEASKMQVEYQGTSQMLADAIQNLKSEKFLIEVEKFDPSSIDLKMD
ncbi:hypothetical protein EPN96_03970 [bacterium]|nr:MAG: hypothetical protein EPN96_03970 [bacterium]